MYKPFIRKKINNNNNNNFSKYQFPTVILLLFWQIEHAKAYKAQE